MAERSNFWKMVDSTKPSQLRVFGEKELRDCQDYFLEIQSDQSAARIFGWDNNDKPGVQLNQQFVISQEQLEQMRKTTAIKTVSLPPDILRKGMERAAFFRMKFSHYVCYLIERDYESGSSRVIIKGGEPPSSKQQSS
jgi:hypothetical protein